MEIKGIKYIIEAWKNADDQDKEGRHNVANMMRENGVAFQLVARRPKGKKLYFINAFENGTFSDPITL